MKKNLRLEIEMHLNHYSFIIDHENHHFIHRFKPDDLPFHIWSELFLSLRIQVHIVNLCRLIFRRSYCTSYYTYYTYSKLRICSFVYHLDLLTFTRVNAYCYLFVDHFVHRFKTDHLFFHIIHDLSFSTFKLKLKIQHSMSDVKTRNNGYWSTVCKLEGT